MAGIVVLSGGGIKSAVTVACCGQDKDFVLLHVDFGQASSAAELEATQRWAQGVAGARVVGVAMSHPLEFQQNLRAAEGVPIRGVVAGVVGTSALQGSSLHGLWPALVWAGVQCALRIGATRIVSGLSRTTDNTHVGLPAVEGQPDRTRELVHALGIAAETMVPAGARIAIETPLVDRALSEIVKLAFHFGLPIDQTWTCCKPPATKRGRRSGCGRCPTCLARAQAFSEAKFADPLVPDPRRNTSGVA